MLVNTHDIYYIQNDFLLNALIDSDLAQSISYCIHSVCTKWNYLLLMDDNKKSHFQYITAMNNGFNYISAIIQYPISTNTNP